MSKPSVRFFARLARGGAGVHAALPPRFGSADALAPLEEHNTLMPAEAGASEPGDPAVPGGQREDAATVGNAAAPEAKQHPATPRTIARPDPTELRLPPDRDTPLPRTAAKPEVDAAPAGKPKPSFAQAVMPLRSPAQAFATLSKPAVELRPPLREAAVSQRAMSRTDGPSVVQVTIDRVDVRLPSGTAPERRAEPRRRASSTVSLSDYLRQRDRSRHGGGA